MFFTYFEPNKISKKESNTLFFELLKNPEIDLSDYKPQERKWKKTTRNIDNKYGVNYYKKHPINIFKFHNLPIPNIPLESISEHYHSFYIPKKTNPEKYRKIDAPNLELKIHQTIFKNFIENELKANPHDAAHAYVKGRSTITAVQRHQKNESKWFLKLDLKDFFPSHNKEYIMRMLKEVYPFAVFGDVKMNYIETIVDYALLEDKLPQGTPISPLITNLCMVPIDFMITKTLQNFNKKHFVYTRYADDLLISCKYKFKPGTVITAINKIFKHYNTPFVINKEKTRFGSSAGRNWNLGIMLNKDNNMTIGHKNNQKFRAMLYDFIINKEQWSVEKAQETLGLISYYKAIEPEYTIQRYNNKYHIDILKELKNIIAN